jgi:hypothetical protein
MFTVIALQSPIAGTRAYRVGECTILYGVENGLWHLSISHEERLPAWEEIKWVRYQFCPKDIMMAMILPPEDQYVNLHENCFHLWQLKVEEMPKKKSKIVLP